VATEDRAAVSFGMSGTYLGGFHGRAPTGRKVSCWGMDIFGFRDGRIVSGRGLVNTCRSDALGAGG
jgi:predicted ester cyclase